MGISLPLLGLITYMFRARQGSDREARPAHTRYVLVSRSLLVGFLFCFSFIIPLICCAPAVREHTTVCVVSAFRRVSVRVSVAVAFFLFNRRCRRRRGMSDSRILPLVLLFLFFDIFSSSSFAESLSFSLFRVWRRFALLCGFNFHWKRTLSIN